MHPPLRRVTKRRKDRSELLECGHEHPGSYRKAQRRRCSVCRDVARAEVRRLREASFKEGAQLDTIIESHQEEIPAYTPEILDAPSGPRCSYCLDSGDLQACSGCNTLLHEDCRAELRRCPTIGCVGPRTLVVATPRQIVVRMPTRSFPKRCWVSFVAAITWILGRFWRRT